MLLLVDAMGGDHAPDAFVNGCIDAITEAEGFEVMLIGDGKRMEKLVNGRQFNSPRLKLTHAGDVITSEDIPTKAIRRKKDSSMVIGFNLLKEQKGDVFISAGNTGALMAGALFILGRIKGVDRPALAPMLPARNGQVMLIDGGMNSECKPVNLLQFGIMGSIYMKEVYYIEEPHVGLVNIGTEANKGTEVVRQAYSMLSQSNINFAGNIEGRDILDGDIDVAVCDGFLGNVLLKFTEGVGPFIFDSLKGVYSKNMISKLSALLVKKDLRDFKKRFDYREHGGARILGVEGKVIKTHGSSDAKAVKNVVLKATNFGKSSIIEKIREAFRDNNVEELDVNLPPDTD